MRLRNSGKNPKETRLEMTSMIDVVFQLLVFFIMTFQIIMIEGSFNIAAAKDGPGPPPSIPIQISLGANTDGTLRDIRLNGRPMKDFKALNKTLRKIIADDDFDQSPNGIANTTTVKIECEKGLHYGNVIKAITAASGYVAKDGKVIHMFKKIKFLPESK